MSLSQHPLSSAFPAMTDVDFEALVADIDKNGQREPAVAIGDEVLDGWHRVQACQKIGIIPLVNEFEGDDPVSFVISKNMHRRHLTASQRAAAAAACSAWRPHGYQNDAHRVRITPQNVIEVTNDDPDEDFDFMVPASAAEIAASAGVSVRSVTQAKQVQRASPDLANAVKEGRISLKRAVSAVNLPPDQQRGVIEGKQVVQIVRASNAEKLLERIRELEAENAELKEKLSEMADTLETYADMADDKDMVTKLAEQKAYTRGVETVRDDLMRQCNELKREVGALRRKVKT